MKMGSEVEVTFCSKGKGKKNEFSMERFVMNFISAHKSQMTFMGLDFKAD